MIKKRNFFFILFLYTLVNATLDEEECSSREDMQELYSMGEKDLITSLKADLFLLKEFIQSIDPVITHELPIYKKRVEEIDLLNLEQENKNSLKDNEDKRFERLIELRAQKYPDYRSLYNYLQEMLSCINNRQNRSV